MPSVLQDIIFVAVVVIAFLALFRVSEGVAKWFENHFRKPSSHSRRREGARKEATVSLSGGGATSAGNAA